MEFHIENTVVNGLDMAVIASSNSFAVSMRDNSIEATEKDMSRGFKLGATKPGEGHDQFLCGITVSFDLYAPLYMWKQLQRYKFFDFVSSQSTMHRLLSFDLSSQCVAETDPDIIKRLDCMKDFYVAHRDEWDEETRQYRWRQLVASLPCGFVLGATMITNYRQLKTMYLQRKNHKLSEWHEFCAWCESLPHFKQLCLGE